MKKTTLTALVFALTAAAVQAAPMFTSAASDAPVAAPGQQIAGYCDWLTTFENHGGEPPAWCGDTDADAAAAPAQRRAHA